MSRALLTVLAAASVLRAGPAEEHFETRVRPVLARQCYQCHGPDKQFSGLRVDSRQALLEGGKRGPAITTDPARSLLMKAIRHDGLAMPPGGRLADRDIAAIEQWIRDGAVWPGGAPVSKDPAWYSEAARTHWAYQPVKSGPANIDRHLNAALAAKRLTPAAPAAKRTLIRRASFVLTGLPPAESDVEAFIRDQSPAAFERVVERLIASPHFGEHWARHWLDLMRYAETRGYEWNYEIIGAWRYRDYLVRAFNADVPYDQFVREHIAGDVIEKPRIANGINESVTATAFYRLGEAGHDDCIKFRELSLDVVDNQIDTLSKAFQGVTLSCARCHGHKLDPIPTADYYGLFGILNGSRARTHTIDAPDVALADEARIRAAKPMIRGELARAWRAAPLDLPGRGRPGVRFDHPLMPWFAMRNTADFGATWSRLAALYKSEREARSAFNRANFSDFGDFRPGVAKSAGWSVDGLGVRHGASKPGEFALASEGAAAVTGLLPAGLHTHAVSDAWNGALRSPLLPKDRKFISVRLLGGRLAARRTVLDNCAIGEGYQTLESNSPSWVRLSTISEEKLPVFLEVVTKHDNPRIPDRPGMLKVSPAEIASPRSYFGVVRAVLHDTPESPREELSHMDRLFATPVTSESELAARYREIARAAIDAWAADRATDDDVRWLDALLSSGVLPNKSDASPDLATMIAAYRALEAKLPTPQVIDGLGDAGPAPDMPVLRAGDPHSPGATAPRRFLSLIGPAWRVPGQGSGRRELAEWIASPANPLTARLMVNRVWSHMFGRGIVTTVDNFGREGERPTHPALLDALAAEFMADGWSVKRLVKRMAMSAAFQRASEPSAEAAKADPRNQLLQHYPLRRLAAEPVRDSILAASGRLDRSLHGPGVAPHRDKPQDYRRLFAGPLDGGGRRSLYTGITRMEGPRFLEIFDYPAPMAARGARDVTNVPAQALALLNDPFVLEQADFWAARLIARGPTTAADRIDAMFRAAFARPPTAAERDRFSGLAAELASLHGVPRAEAASSRAVWKDVAHALFNVKEFIYIQ